MAPLLRRRLLCFYCGCRSAQKATSDLRQWQCENCEAVNHLDEVCLPESSFSPFFEYSRLTLPTIERRNYRSTCIGYDSCREICSGYQPTSISSLHISRRDFVLLDVYQESTPPYAIIGFLSTSDYSSRLCHI